MNVRVSTARSWPRLVAPVLAGWSSLAVVTPARSAPAQGDVCLDKRQALNREAVNIVRAAKALEDCKKELLEALKDDPLSTRRIDGDLVNAYKTVLGQLEKDNKKLTTDVNALQQKIRELEASLAAKENAPTDTNQPKREPSATPATDELKKGWHVPFRVSTGYTLLDLEDEMIEAGAGIIDRTGPFIRFESGFGGYFATGLRIGGILGLDVAHGWLRIDASEPTPVTTRRIGGTVGFEIAYSFGKAQWIGLSGELAVGFGQYRDYKFEEAGTTPSVLYPKALFSFGGGVSLELVRGTVRVGFRGWTDNGPRGFQLHIGTDLVMLGRWMCKLSERCRQRVQKGG